MVKYRFFASRQIEVAMIGQVDNRWFIRGCRIVQNNFIPIGQFIGYRKIQIAGKTAFHIGTPVFKDNDGGIFHRIKRIGIECPAIETAGSSMNGMSPTVFLQLINPVAQAKLRIPDAVGIPSNGSAKLGMLSQIVLQAVKP